MKTERKALMLSAGYGRGHHAAARALAEELTGRGWQVYTTDICDEAQPRFFHFTQRLYRFCIRHSPWLWGILYKQLDTADWASLIHSPGIAASTRHLRQLLSQMQPDLVVCTYPLFAYMMDACAREDGLHIPYAVVVTDSLAISRAWVQTNAPLICLPDEHSLELVQTRFGLPEERLEAPGFPVRKAFAPGADICPLGAKGEGLHLVYAPHAPLKQVQADVAALLAAWPCARISIPAEDRAEQLRSLLAEKAENIDWVHEESDMADLLRTAHFYIGKAGAASLYEAYSAEVPVIINYTLPGQEEGNLQLLLRDGAGACATTTHELVRTLSRLLADSAKGWQQMRQAMRTARRSGGAARTADALERRFFS